MLIKFSNLMKKYKLNIKGILHVGAHECEEEKDYHAFGIKKIIWLEALQEKVNKHKNKNIHQIVVDVIDNNEVTFNITNNHQSSSIYELKEHLKHHPSIHVTEKRTLKTKRIDTLFKEQNIPSNYANFANLDIQGNELNALKSMGDILQNIDYIYSEVNTDYLYKDIALLPEIDEYLKEKGFKRVEIKMTKFKWGDAFYIRN
jgi:FkbM family methyltransferase